MADVDACAALPWVHALAPVGGPLTAVTDDEKRMLYARVVNAFGDVKPAASAYRLLSNLRLELDFVIGLVGQRLASEFIPGIVRICPGFDGFPLPARRAIVDMAYNLGIGGLARFPHMLAACNAGDWATAAAQCHRSTCRDSRNVWTSQMFVDASVANPPVTS